MLHRMIEVLNVDIKKEDLQYEELVINKQVVIESSY
jgi:hypothetical protein